MSENSSNLMSIGELKPCPFCGGRENLRVCHDKELGHFVVECSPAYRKPKCTAMGPWGSTRDEAIAGWNRRQGSSDETKECRTDSRLAGDIEYCLAKINPASDVHAILTEVMTDLRAPKSPERLLIADELLAAVLAELPDPDFIPDPEKENAIRKLIMRIGAYLSVNAYMTDKSSEKASA